jgi:phosphate transport system permease protein
MSSGTQDLLPMVRRPRTKEAWLRRALAALALALGSGYVVLLGHLLLKGGYKALALSYYAMPLSGVKGEDTVRFAVALIFFGVPSYVLGRWVAPYVGASKAPPPLPPDAPKPSLPPPSVAATAATGSAAAPVFSKGSAERLPFVAFVVGGLLGGLFLRHHLPRFLIFLPSETHAGGGIGPEIFNTLYFAVLSTLVTLPIGVGAALYMARFAKPGPFVHILRTALDTLSSLPSIVYGLFGFLVFVVQMRAGYSLLAGAFVLALLNLPLVVGITEESLRSVPRELEDASLALGATTVDTAFRVTVPYAWPGILSAIVLSIGRVFAESAPLVMTAGTTISRANAYSLNPFRGGETLAVHLWYVNSAGLSPDKGEVSAGTAAVLVLLILLTNTLAARLARFGGATGPRARGAVH